MGGCTSRPRNFDDLHPEPVPSPTPKTAEAAVPETNQNKEEAEKQDQPPLVDLSEPKQEGGNESSEPNTNVAVPASTKSDAVTGQPKTEDKVETTVVPSDKNVEVAAAVVVPKEQMKEPEAKESVAAAVAPKDEQEEEPKAKESVPAAAVVPNDQVKEPEPKESSVAAAAVPKEQVKEPEPNKSVAAPTKVENKNDALLVTL